MNPYNKTVEFQRATVALLEQVAGMTAEEAIAEQEARFEDTATGDYLDTLDFLNDAQRDNLRAAGYASEAALRSAGNLKQVEGIGEATASKIQDALAADEEE